jgi:outer membrane receptor for ferrienterochelin and colicin
VKKSVLLRSCAAFIVPISAGAIVATPALAQETSASIRGQVVSNGQPVPNASVTVTHLPSGSVSRTTSDANGNFSAPGLRVGGPYTLVITAKGMESTTVTDAYVQAGEPLQIPVQMVAAAPQQEAIVITTARTGAREQSQGPITALNRTQIEGVASVNRDVRDIARRDPFATIDLTNSRTIEIAGNNGRLNRFSVDGAQFSDVFGLNNGGLPTNRGPVPLDAIEQFSVKVAPFDISEGNFQGGSINVILRSGTNKYHGSAFYSYTDQSLTGSKTRDRTLDLSFKSKQYGAFVSGPIIRDRLFFMAAYEKTTETTPFDAGVGAGFATQVPGITEGDIDTVTSTSNSVFGYDPLGLIQNAVENDEKYVVKLDANVTDNQRASVTFIHNNGTNQFQQDTFTTSPFSLGLQSNGYELSEVVNTGVFQLNSNWSDNFSSEFRTTYTEYERDQTPFGGRNFAQFEVCLDPASNGSVTSCTGSRLFLGPDVSRQSNDLNNENLSVEFRPKLTLGSHSLKGLVGWNKTHTYNLFIQRSLGDVYFDSLADFANRKAGRVRLGGAVPSLNPADAAADFNTNALTLGVQDDWNVNDALQVTAGVRWDYYYNHDKPPLNPNFQSRYGFTNQETFDGRGLLQPRLGFNWKAAPRLIVKGGTGIFGGGTPQVFLSNSFSNTGLLSNQIDISRQNPTGSPAGLLPVCSLSATTPNRAAICDALNNVTGTNFPIALTDFLANNTASLATAPVNAIDPDLKLASQWRSTLSFNYNANLPVLGDNWLFGADLLYSKIINAYQWTDIRSIPIGTLPDGRNRYGPFGGVASTNQDLLMTNSHKGRSIIGVLRFSKAWDWGLRVDGSYTRQNVKDENALTSATAGSLYSQNAFFDSNSAAYGRSIYEIKNSYKFTIDYNHAFFGDYKTRFSIFGDYHSGRPYSITGLDRGTGRLPVFGTVGNAGRQLLYIPTAGNDPLVSFDSAASQAAFDALVGTLGLEKYRGRVVPKNSQTSPHFFKVDLHLSQEIPTFVGGSRIELFADVENFLNLLNKNWSSLRQVSFPYTASIVTVTCAAGGTAANPNCTKYQYSRVTDPTLTLSSRQSLYQFRLGARVRF